MVKVSLGRRIPRPPLPRKRYLLNADGKKETSNVVVKKAKLRKSLKPGTVCILLAGPYKGRRVVLLKVFDSGLLLITGPFRVNGIPMRRVHPKFVIATSTTVPVEGIDLQKFDENYFAKKPMSKEERRTQEGMAKARSIIKNHVSKEQRRQDQDVVDASLLTYLNSAQNADLKQYLKTRFTLSSKMIPHTLKF